jgi:putative transcriptional regulator
MDKARNIGTEVLEGIRALKGGESGRVTRIRSVSQIRESIGLSQQHFARLLGVSIRTLQEWEQGRRSPSGAARTLLLLAGQDPKILLKVA